MSKKIKARRKRINCPPYPKLVLYEKRRGVFQVLYMDPRFHTQPHYCCDDYNPEHRYIVEDYPQYSGLFRFITSECHPEIFENEIYLHGSDPERDTDPMSVPQALEQLGLDDSHLETVRQDLLDALKFWSVCWDGWKMDLPKDTLKFSIKQYKDIVKNLIIFV